MNRFSKLHPLAQFIFFMLTFFLVLCINNPFFSVLCLLCAVLYRTKIKSDTLLKSIGMAVVLILTTAVFNMLFVHYGETVFFEIRALPCTAESFLYGANQGTMLSAVILWFVSFGEIFDSERILYLFRFTPKIALIFSMVLGFIPRFNKKIIQIGEAKRALNGGVYDASAKEKMKEALSNFSALITYSLESSIITAQSMNARKYNPKAISPGRFRYTFSDIAALVLLIVLCAVIVYEKAIGHIQFTFNPKISSTQFSPAGIICFAILQLFPLILDLWEDMQWKLSNAKN